jgi:MHS family proline/betaine transporter-like MFS transporter
LEPTSRRRVIIAGMIGNALEWYDFSIYGYFVGAIGQHFFPRENHTAQLLAAFGVFAIGYMMRPIGGAVVGHIGDRLGRRAALTFSVAAMAIPTFLIGLLPGYATLGVAAPILFTLLRMMQGLSTGGEYTSSLVFLVERAPPGRRGLTAAFGPFGAIAGILMGSAMGWLFAAVMSPEALADWGWRIPFLLGLAVGLAGFFLRRNMPELPRIEQRGRAPLAEVFRDHWRLLITLAAFSVFNGVSFYITFVYVASWLQSIDRMPLSRALEINTISMCLMPAMFLVTAWFSDRYGRKPLLLASTIAGFFAAVPLFLLMEHPGPIFALLGQIGLTLIVAVFIGAQAASMVEIAPARVRCTAVGLGYNITLGVVGGMTPLAATWLVQRTGDELAPAFLIMTAAVITLLAILRLPETYRATLGGETTSTEPVQFAPATG